MLQLMYCIDHETWAYPLSYPMCLFVSCPPPELEENWQDNIPEPPRFEIEIMDLSANELELSL